MLPHPRLSTRTLWGIVLALILANLGLWWLRLIPTLDFPTVPLAATSPSRNMVSVAYRGVELPKNWSAVIYGEAQALATLMAEPFWQKALGCVRWPIAKPQTAPVEDSVPIFPNLAPWADWQSSPSVAAMLHAWQTQLGNINPAPAEESLPIWFALKLNQEVIKGELSDPTSYVWRYPLPLWAKLSAFNQQEANPPSNTKVPSSLTFWFADAASAESAMRALTPWLNDEAAQGLTLTHLPPPRSNPLQHWFAREWTARYAQTLAPYPFWRNRKSCENDL